jgi:AraC-like DNA-binding protein
VVSEPSALFRLEYCDVRFWYPWHFHPELEVKHVVRGTGTRIVGDSVEPFSDGDFCLVGSGTPHCWSSKLVKGQWVRARVVQFAPDALGAAPLLAPMADLLRRGSTGLEVGGAARAEAISEMTRLFEARTEARQLVHLVGMLAAMADSAEVRPLGGAPSVRVPNPQRALNERVLTYLQEHAYTPISEEATARHFGQSASAFSRSFKQQFGKSFSRYVVELRIARASNLLLTQPLEVKEIARLSGFGTVASLNRHFRAVKMTTPTAYRRRGRELNSGLLADPGELVRCDGLGRRPASAARGTKASPGAP